jgi:hypothetical protein
MSMLMGQQYLKYLFAYANTVVDGSLHDLGRCPLIRPQTKKESILEKAGYARARSGATGD